MSRYVHGSGATLLDAEGDVAMEMVEVPDLDDWDDFDEPLVPIPEDMAEKEVFADYRLKATAYEQRRQEKIKKRKSHDQTVKETLGKFNAAGVARDGKRMVKVCKKT